MGVLEQVMQMRNQGIPDQDIVSQLQEQGMNPRTINDALNQANIKSAVGGMEDIGAQMEYSEGVPIPQNQEGQGYQQSSQEYNDDFYTPQEGYSQAQAQQYSPGAPSSGYQEFYPQEQGNYGASGTDADTMVEIAQQVFSEKIKKIAQQLEDLNEFKTLYQTKTDSIYERLKRIESIMDRLQSAILEKVGSYGEGIETVKKELSMMQDSYGKIMGAVAEKHHAPSSQTHHIVHHKASPSSSNVVHHKAYPSKNTPHSAPKHHTKKTPKKHSGKKR